MRKSLYLLALAVLAAGCHLDKLLSDGSGGGASPHGTGAFTAAATTSGSNLPTGYTVTLDSNPSTATAIGINGTITATGIPAGSHRAALGGVPNNCSVSGANPRSVTVPANDTARTTFSVACTAPATQLAFTIEPPSTVTVLSDTFQVEVAAEDAAGNIVPGFSGQVTMAIGTDGSLGRNAHLKGTTQVNLVNGIATFPNLSIDQTGANYTLKASVPGLPDASSTSFNVIAVP